MAPPAPQMPTIQQAPQQVTLTQQVGSASDIHMRSTRRDTSTMMEVERPTRTRTMDQLGPFDTEAQPTLYQRSDNPPDMTMGLICAPELPHGDSLEAAVNLDAEERNQEEPVDESEELWMPTVFPPELVKEGKEKELTSMRDFGVYRSTSEDRRYHAG